jgi:EmrB/QacA subfamily drug resistance transporter
MPGPGLGQRAVAQQREPITPLVWKISGVVMLGPLMTGMDATIVNVSLSALGRELHAGLATIQWVSSAYMLALALTLPLSGWLVDRIGARRVYLLCFSVFTLTSLLCGAADSAAGLIFFRVLQGAAGGLLAPMGQMMTARIAGRDVARVMGLIVMPAMIGPVLGPTLAGFILQHWSWRWIFFINLPIGVLSTWLAWRVLPPDTDEINPRPLDIGGLLILSPALAMLLHSLESLGSGAAVPWSGAELAAALLLLVVFFRHARRRGETALIDLRLFRQPTFAAATATQFLSNCVLYGGQMLMPLYLLLGEGRSPGATGALLAAGGLGMMCAYPMLGALTDRFGPRNVAVAGAVVALLGTLPFAWRDAGTLSDLSLCIILFVRGIGASCVGIPSISVAYSAIPRETIPVATTALNIVQRLGGPVAMTFLALFLHFRMETQQISGAAAFPPVFWLLSLMHVLTILSATRLPERLTHRK